jgi:hypothetical protein
VLSFLLLQILLLASAPQQSNPAELRAQEGFRISGTVVDALSGQPLSKTRLSLAIVGQGEDFRFAQSDKNGSFSFEGVAAGKYRLMAQRAGYSRQAYEQHEVFATAIVAGPGLNSENIRFGLQPGASLSGQVLDENSEPLRHAQVVLLRDGLRFGSRGLTQQRQAATNDEGRYRFSRLDPGTYLVAVSARPWYTDAGFGEFGDGIDPAEGHTSANKPDPAFDVVYPIVFYSNATDPAGAARFILHPGDTESADFVLRPVPALHLRVKSASEGTSESVGISVMQILGQNIQLPVAARTRSVEPGVFEISGLSPGRFSVGLYSSGEIRGSRISGMQSIQLTGSSELDLSNQSGASLVGGAVKMADGSAVPQNSTAQLRNLSTGDSSNCRVEAEGEFSFRFNSIPPGRYEFAVIQNRYFVVNSVSATGAKVSGQILQITSGQEIRISAVISRGGTPIDGVALRNGKPAPGVMVLLVPGDPENHPSLFRRTQSDSDGTFTLPNAFPGRYTALAFEDGWNLEWARIAVLQKFLPHGEPVEVVARQKYNLSLNVQ